MQPNLYPEREKVHLPVSPIPDCPILFCHVQLWLFWQCPWVCPTAQGDLLVQVQKGHPRAWPKQISSSALMYDTVVLYNIHPITDEMSQRQIYS